MYCPKCGALNPDSARLCSACGQIMEFAVPQVPDSAMMRPQVSGWAVATLVLGILSPFTCMLTTLPAVITGIIALVKIGNSNGRSTGTGMAIAGMALPVVMLPFAAIGMGIMMPALARVPQLAFRTTCRTNLVELGKAMHVYAGDYDGQFPTPPKWCDLLSEYSGVSRASFRCRGAAEGPCNYAMNKDVEAMGTSAPPDMVLLFETAPGWNQFGGPEIFTTENHQGEGCNVLFVDGHVQFVKPVDFQRLRWTTGEAPNEEKLQRGFQLVRPKQNPAEQEVDFPAEPPTRIVEVLGNVPGVDYCTWQNTGVMLHDGDVLYIEGEGHINYVNDLTVTPDGRGNTFYPSLLPDVSFASLVGRTHFDLLDDGNDSSGEGLYGPGFVGSRFKMTYHGRSTFGLTGDNVLYLAVNDSMDNDNSLSFTARIWVVRNGQVVHDEPQKSPRAPADSSPAPTESTSQATSGSRER